MDKETHSFFYLVEINDVTPVSLEATAERSGEREVV